ncbi:cyclin-dependent kinase inhibitor 1Ba [Oryzias melastigma]|uniref:Cyclin-dependent kinase inhibitor 1B n=1 Tax=Oryzias melastigma TaxID=30732 RepID=A0A3B3C557_ORYME|nr:cyclin-dependent kinase inhibitor 1Ba [Oryzias melastigma]XP_036066173.1 cyclin-dependent kinase inhibitor 1Ba [Oryzias melastigma]
MSDVRLSSGSPTTVERVEARQQDSVRQVRRALFGTPDPEETRRYLAELTREGARDFAQRYNFDPLSERPLPPGNYEWQRDDDAPEFYTRPPHGSRRAAGSSREDAERRTGALPGRSAARKRRADASDCCSKPCPNKRSRPDEDDPEDQSDGAGSQALSVGPTEADSTQDVP